MYIACASCYIACASCYILRYTTLYFESGWSRLANLFWLGRTLAPGFACSSRASTAALACAVPRARRSRTRAAGGARGRRSAKLIKVYTWFAHWCAGAQKSFLTIHLQFANNGERFALLTKRFTSEVTNQQKKFTLMQKKFALMQKKFTLTRMFFTFLHK